MIHTFSWRPFVLLCAFSLCCLFLCGPTACVWAAKIKVWNHHAPSHYDKAQLKQSVVSNEGTLRLARQLKPLTGLDATHVWSIVEDKDGNLCVATGEDGKIYRVTSEGKVSVLFASEDSQVLCLALSPDGFDLRGDRPWRAHRPHRCERRGQGNFRQHRIVHLGTRN